MRRGVASAVGCGLMLLAAGTRAQIVFEDVTAAVGIEGPELDYADDTGYFPVNPAMVFKLPGTEMLDPNRWQPLAFDFRVLQNGIVIGESVQDFIGPNWGKVAPFALTENELSFPWVYHDPGPPPQLGGLGDAQYKANAVEVVRYNSLLDPSVPETIDISPGSYGNNTLGTYDGTGHPLNPYTNAPYEPNVVKVADFGRVMAEFWADGPMSETPPGHWNTLANYVADHPLFEKRFAGQGEVLDDLEWDVKTYLALNGAVHDAAIFAWGCKGYYDYSRPISHIRYMSGLGQSSDPSGPSYHPDGIPLEPGLIEVATSETTQPGERHEELAGYEGEIAVRAWRAPADPLTEAGGVHWIRGTEWLPYQRVTFVTPAFAGYVSGHSTFSRAGAEVMTAITGSPFFPGGLGTFLAPANDFLAFELGPSETVELQFATYYDASDMAGVSRLWGGIHPRADDLPGRIVGSMIGIEAWNRAQEFFGTHPVTVCHTPDGDPAHGSALRIAPAGLDDHLAAGDLMGPCKQAVAAPVKRGTDPRRAAR